MAFTNSCLHPTFFSVAPAPRPRSMLVGDTVDDTLLLTGKPSSPKKRVAPQPKPRTILSRSSSSEIVDCDEQKALSNDHDEGEDELKRKSQTVFMNKNVPNSVLYTHKACINELSLRLEKRNSIDFEKIETRPELNKVVPDQNISIENKLLDELQNGMLSSSTLPSDAILPDKDHREESQQNSRENHSVDTTHDAALVVDKMKGVHVHVYITCVDTGDVI